MPEPSAAAKPRIAECFTEANTLLLIAEEVRRHGYTDRQKATATHDLLFGFISKVHTLLGDLEREAL